MAEVLTELVAKITADAAELKKGLADAEGATKKSSERMSESLKRVGIAMAAAGAAITAAFTGAIMSFAKTGSALNDLSLKTGVSVKALAGLKYAAEQNGATMGTVEMAIRRTASAMQDARDGLAETKRGFDRMGLSLSALEGLNPEQQFLMIASAIAEIPDPMTRAATAQDIFGRSGMDMLPMLAEGAEGLRRMMEEGVALTGWTEEGVKQADALGDAFDTLKTATTGVFNEIGSALAPALKDILERISGLIKRVGDWAREHPGLTRVLSLTGVALGGVLTAAGGLILILPSFIAGIKSLSVAFGVLSGAISLTALLVTGLVVGVALLSYGIYSLIRALKGERLEDNFFAQVAKDIESLANVLLPAVTATADKATESFMKASGGVDGLSRSIGGLTKEMDEADKSWEAFLKDVEDAASGMKAYGLETADIVRYMAFKWNSSFEEAARRIAAAGISVNDLRFRLKDLGITALEVTGHLEELGLKPVDGLGKLKDGVDGLNRGLDETKSAVDSVTQSFEKMIQSQIAAAQARESEFTARGIFRQGTSQWQAEQDRLAQEQKFAQLAREALAAADERLAQRMRAEGAIEPPTGWDSEYWADVLDEYRAEERAKRNIRQVFEPGRSYATGGIVPGPTGSPQLAMVHGGETIIPANESGGGGISITFTEPVFFDREDTMNKFVRMIRNGIQRQDRLRFGGAYNGG